MTADAEARVPVVVIGAGACGLIAALAAHDQGAEVIVLERDATPAGSTALSSGFIPAAGTRWQRAQGVEDSPQRFVDDIMAKNGGGADRRIVDAVCADAAPTLAWLADRHGVDFVLVDGFRYPGHSTLRMHAVVARTGAALMDALLAACARARIDIVTSARVTELVADAQSRIEQVVFARPDGAKDRVGCDAVMLACSGFGGNPALVRVHLPSVADALYFGHAGNQGDALTWGQALGAAVSDLSGYQGHGSVATPCNILLTWALMMEGGIQVNAAGRRFSDEHQGYSEQCEQVLAQAGSFAWNVFDARLHAIGMDFDDYRSAHAAGAVKVAPDVETLAALTGAPLHALRETLTHAARCAQGSETDGFGRDFSTKPALAPPFHVARVTGALFHTQGGLAVDEAARVLRADGTALPNLFAGGGAARGVSGDRASGYLSGNGLLTAATLGRIGGESAAALVARNLTRP